MNISAKKIPVPKADTDKLRETIQRCVIDPLERRKLDVWRRIQEARGRFVR